MLNKTILTFSLALLGLCQSAFAITFINQTNSVKRFEVVEAYRPVPEKAGDLAAPKSLGHTPKKITLAPHSQATLHLKSTPNVLLISTIKKTVKGKKTTTLKETLCFEPYDFQNQPENHFHDAWGFVIHKPLEEQPLSISDPDYFLKKRDLEDVKERGYGIMCLHPLLLIKVTSVEMLPKELRSHTAGKAPWSRQFISQNSN